jgi:hypothetical protein
MPSSIRSTLKTPSLLVAPDSFRSSLATILELSHMQIGNGYALIDQIDPQDALTFSGGGFVSQNHLAPSPENLQILQYLGLKMILHLRDPRQALLSWVY